MKNNLLFGGVHTHPEPISDFQEQAIKNIEIDTDLDRFFYLRSMSLVSWFS